MNGGDNGFGFDLWVLVSSDVGISVEQAIMHLQRSTCGGGPVLFGACRRIANIFGNNKTDGEQRVCRAFEGMLISAADVAGRVG